jgi:carboxyl-terminal processing protease
MSRNLRALVRLAGSIIAISLAFGLGLVIGATTATSGSPPLQILRGNPPVEILQDAQATDFGVFWEAWRTLQENYYKGPLDPQTLKEGAIKGIAEATGDRFTIFQDTESARRSQTRLSGSFVGIGIRIELREGVPFIVQPIPEAPAELAGVGPNEFILAVDGVSTKNLSLAEVGEIVRGQPGTEVTLTLRRLGGTQLRDVTIVRARVVVASVAVKLLDDIAYMRINMFSSRTPQEVGSAINKLRRQSISHLVIDLRNNFGGLLNASVDVASHFLPRGVLVLRQESRGEPSLEFRTTSGAHDTEMSIVVLINGGTASAAEIVAGALQTHGRALLVGEETFGKGSMQELHRLSDGSIIRVTSGIWVTPAGINLGDRGLIPDLEVENKDGHIGGSKDPILQAGVGLLLQGDS